MWGMISVTPVSQEERVLVRNGLGLWASFSPRDRRVFGPGATRELRLRNTSGRDITVRGLDLRWVLRSSHSLRWEYPQVLASGQEATVLDLHSFSVLTRLAQQCGQRSFGFDQVVHEIGVVLDGPERRALTFRVQWGFATPSLDLGFFLLDEVG